MNSEHQEYPVRALVDVFLRWKLSKKQSAILSGETARDIQLTSGEGDCDQLLRIKYLLTIDHYLHQLFPHDIDLADLWMRHENIRFSPTPIIYVKENGAFGLAEIESYLIAECHN